jgi:carbon-monoxide dehydrogenase iron sulfur subunit
MKAAARGGLTVIGWGGMRKILRVNLANCTGCQSCVVTCSLIKHGVFDREKALIKIWKNEIKCLAIPLVCEHCENPTCIEVCPQNAITKDPLTGVVKIDPNLCTGCGVCRDACPFGSEIIRLKNGVAVKCDLCDGAPVCVEVCLQKALQYVMATEQNVRLKNEWADERIRAITAFTGL